jgi:peptidyl-dipeptidase A
MALLAGLQAYLSGFFHQSKQAESSLRRRQLIFSRWVLVMTHFERELYLDPQQDLNQLWWQMVEKYQKISASRIGASDWAAKYHIGLAPVYYYSYLLGELFASTIHLKVQPLGSSQAGHFLQKKLFSPGNRMHWTELVQHVTGEPLNTQAWMQQFAL